MPDNGNKNTAENKSSSENFFVNELKERISINKKSKDFKAAVDSVKGAALEKLDEEYSRRNEQMTSELSQIENALMSDDPEQIKNALKGFKSIQLLGDVYFSCIKLIIDTIVVREGDVNIKGENVLL